MVVPDDGKRYCLVLGVPHSLGAPDLLYLLWYAYIIYTYMVILAKIDTWIVMNDIPTILLRYSCTAPLAVMVVCVGRKCPLFPTLSTTTIIAS